MNTLHMRELRGGNRTDATFQMSPQMVKKMLHSSNKVRNARIISESSSWTPGDKIISFGKMRRSPYRDGLLVVFPQRFSGMEVTMSSKKQVPLHQ